MNKDIIEEARSWVGTPYHHQARLKGVGVDCANLIAGIAENCGWPSVELEPYSNQWNLHNEEEKMINILESYGCVSVHNLFKPFAGAIITFRFGRVSGHIGIMTSENTFVHADLRAGKVTEVTLGGDWLKRLSGIYIFPEKEKHDSSILNA